MSASTPASPTTALSSTDLSGSEATSASRLLSSWAFTLLAASAALVLGFAFAESWIVGVAALAAFLVLFGFVLVPLSVPIKLVFLLISVAFLQKSIGYFKLGEVRGLNVGNLLLAAAFSYWLLTGLRTGRWYRRTPIDFWILVGAIVIPLLSIFFTLAFREVPAYSQGEQLGFYKQWVTPFVYFFLLCQCLDRRKDIRLLLALVLFLVGVAILDTLPETLRFSSWHESRSEGFVQEANSYAALLATTAPFAFLLMFLRKDRPVLWLLSLLLIGGMAISILTTYSRSGYLGFGVALAGAVYVSYRGTGRFPVGVPVLVLGGLALLPIVLVPQLMDYVKERFEVKTYKRAKRMSYGRYGLLNQYSGDRLEIWKSAVEMSQESPVFGVGFNAFPRKLPKYHARGFYNMTHNQFLWALAEGGVVWLAAMVMLFWKLFRFLYQNWKVTLAEKDVWGQIVCGGAVVCYLVMLWISLTLDFHHPGPKTTIFWVVMAGGVRYGMLPPGEETEETTAGRTGHRRGALVSA